MKNMPSLCHVAALCLVVFVLAGSIYALPRRRFSTTTTTTTTTTTSFPLIEEGGVQTERQVVSECRCCGTFACIANISNNYVPSVQSMDFATLTENLGRLCLQHLPAAEQCLKNHHNSACHYITNTVTMLQRYCPFKEVMENGMACWTQGFQEGMQSCVTAFTTQWAQSANSDSGDSSGNIDIVCQAVAGLKTCADLMMTSIPDCRPWPLRNLVQGFVRNNSLAICPDQ